MPKARKAAILFLFSIIFFVFSGISQANNDAERIRGVITRLGTDVMTDKSIPGMSVAFLKKGENIPIGVAFGTACIENKVSMTSEKKIKIGSITKLFTAALVYKLIEEGKIGFDTTIDRFFPEFPDGKLITIRNLLNHTSGIVDMLRLPAVNTNMTKAWSVAELIDMVAKTPLVFVPGTKQQYSNSGYLMLAVISERVSGKTYEEEIKEMFCDRLGMQSLSVGNDQDIVPYLSCGYSMSSDKVLTQPLMAGIAMAKGTGNLIGSPSDVVRLVNLDRVLKNDFIGSAPLVPLRLANGEDAVFPGREEGCKYSASFLDGSTLFLFDEPSIALVGKLGSFPGFGTVFFYDQKTQFAVAISVNNERTIPKAIVLGAKILYELRN